ncbi:MAG: hypothetical protein R3F62_12760 [Planctomycetota bacterium]
MTDGSEPAPRPARFARVERACARAYLAGHVALWVLAVAYALVWAHAADLSAGTAGTSLAALGLAAALVPARWLRALGADPRRRRALGLLGAVAAALVTYALWRAAPFVPGLIAAALLVSSAGLALARARESARPLLALAAPLAAALLLLSVELHWSLTAAQQIEWGDVFRPGFGQSLDVLGPGGRLRADLRVRMRSSEYPYGGAPLFTDAQGFRAREPVRSGPHEGPRVLNLGDSFSVGYRLGQDDFFGARLAHELAQRGPCEVVSAEVSDPAHALYYLETSGANLGGELVLVGICGNDALQAAHFLGPEGLFQLDAAGHVRANATPPAADAWAPYRELRYPRPASFTLPAADPEVLAASLALTQDPTRAPFARLKLPLALREPARPMPSLLFSSCLDLERRDGHKRLLDGEANLGLYLREPPPRVEAIYADLFTVLRALRALTAARGQALALVAFPHKFEVHPEEWALMRGFWNLDPADFDLEGPRARLAAFCAEVGIAWIDPTPALREEARQRPGSLYFPLGDIHLNLRGTAVVARVAADAVREALPR